MDEGKRGQSSPEGPWKQQDLPESFRERRVSRMRRKHGRVGQLSGTRQGTSQLGKLGPEPG